MPEIEKVEIFGGMVGENGKTPEEGIEQWDLPVEAGGAQ